MSQSPPKSSAAKPAAQRELRPAEAKAAAARQVVQPSRRRKLTAFDLGFLIGLIAVAIGIFAGFGAYAGSQGDLAEYLTHQFNQPFSPLLSKMMGELSNRLLKFP